MLKIQVYNQQVFEDSFERRVSHKWLLYYNDFIDKTILFALPQSSSTFSINEKISKNNKANLFTSDLSNKEIDNNNAKMFKIFRENTISSNPEKIRDKIILKFL